MALFTVDDARKLLPSFKNDRLYKNEIKKFNPILRIFVIWFYIVSSVRTFFVATIVVALFKQQPDLSVAMVEGYGWIGIAIYLGLSIIDLMRLLDLGLIITVIICSFTLGNGITSNFAPYLLPILGVYAAGFVLIVITNIIFNKIVKSLCPKIAAELELYASQINNMQRMV